MKAVELYKILDSEFLLPNFSDDWEQAMTPEIKQYFCDTYKMTSIGLMCDFTKEINKVYTAVFASTFVMERIISDGQTNAMLFCHHPSEWDINDKRVFIPMQPELLEEFKKRKISIFNYHVPLDHYSDVSTSVTLARAFGIEVMKPFGQYHGSQCGVIGLSARSNLVDLKNKIQNIVMHDCKLYPYGEEELKEGLIGVVGGGGNEKDILEELKKLNINTLITGVTTKNQISKKAHDFAQENKINIIGCSHYSSEKFACIAMVDYFVRLGLASEFIQEKPCMEDM